MIVREYFDQELLGRASPLLSGETRLPEMTVTKNVRGERVQKVENCGV
ncbi:MAG: hypothetical protein ACRD2N_23495 [Vicinamibacterales bacterium]